MFWLFSTKIAPRDLFFLLYHVPLDFLCSWTELKSVVLSCCLYNCLVSSDASARCVVLDCDRSRWLAGTSRVGHPFLASRETSTRPTCSCLSHVARRPSPRLTSLGSLSHKSHILSSLRKFDGSGIQPWLLRRQRPTWGAHLTFTFSRDACGDALIEPQLIESGEQRSDIGEDGGGASAPAGMKMMSLPWGEGLIQ